MLASNFDLRDLEVFTLAYELGSLSRTAETLYTSRQSITRSLERLENLMGLSLFERDAKGVTPNDFARTLYPRAKELLQEAEAFLNLRDSHAEERPFSIGVIGQYNTGNFLERLVEEFCSQTGAQISVKHVEWPDILSDVSSHKLDFAYVALVPEYIPQELAEYPITQDQFFLVVRRDSPYAALPCLSAGELNGKQLLLLSRYNIQRGIVKPYLEQNQLSLKRMLTTSDVFILDSYVENSNCMVLVLGYVADQLLKLHPDYVKLPLDPPLYRNSGIVYRRSMPLSPQQRQVLSLLRQSMESQL